MECRRQLAEGELEMKCIINSIEYGGRNSVYTNQNTAQEAPTSALQSQRFRREIAAVSPADVLTYSSTEPDLSRPAYHGQRYFNTHQGSSSHYRRAVTAL